MGVTIGKIFDLTVQKSPNKEAIHDVRKNVRWSYREWSAQINRLANALPQNASGKIQKFILRKQLEDLFAPGSSSSSGAL